MIGVTFFGLLLTPAFCTVVMKLGRRKATASKRQPAAPVATVNAPFQPTTT
jgi:hypothetical protein